MSAMFGTKVELLNAYAAMKATGGTVAEWHALMLQAIAAMRFFANEERKIADKAGINAGHGAAASQIDLARMFWEHADAVRANCLLAKAKAEQMAKLAA